jgi:U3 small nucleolar RNA-associated protein 12
MPKAYLRYEEEHVFGVIASPSSNVAYDKTGKLAVVGALETCTAWKIKGGEAVKKFRAPLLTRGQGGRTVNEMAPVTRVQMSPDGAQVATGFDSGDVRTFNVSNEKQLLCLRGHRKAVSALAYTKDGSLLASGGEDCEIVVWDVTSETGLYRLRGHRGAVTDLKFLYNDPDSIDTPTHLISSSKDTFIKVWDLEAQFCIDTIVGHRAEVWSFDIDPAQRRMVTLSTSAELRIWRIDNANIVLDDGKSEDERAQSGGGKILTKLGTLTRKTMERGITVRFSRDGTLLGCHGAGKQLEIYRVRTGAEVEKRVARRRKRQREKQAKATGVTVTDEAAEATPYNATDEYMLAAIVRGSAKLRSFAFSPGSSASEAGGGANVLLALQNNAIEQRAVDFSDKRLVKQGAAPTELTSTLAQQGHRGDVRAVCINQADDTVASVGKKTLKLWNVRTRQCIISAEINYGVSVQFIPGDAHVLVGTKKGDLLLYSLATGDCVQELTGAHGGELWSIDIKPDGMGFATGGADHEVKFWKFAVADDGQPRFTASRTLQLSDDVLCVKYTHTKDSQKLLVCASLLDSTIKIFFEDSLKFFLSLYGHRLPVLTLDVSTDNTLCITGSADKNVKIWGLDFGDCHKSMFLHTDSITSVQFVPKTHMFFSCSKDGTVKMVDADTFHQIQVLNGHHSEVWCLAVSRLGDFVVSGSNDRSLRVWKRTEEQLFLEEERERELNRTMEADLERSVHGGSERLGALAGEEQNSMAKSALAAAGVVAMDSADAGQRTVTTVKAGEQLMEALELAVQEENAFQTYTKLVKAKEEGLTRAERAEREALAQGGKKVPPLLEAPSSNILLLGRSPLQHMLYTLRKIPASEIEEALLVLPFDGVNHLINFLSDMIRERMQVELVARVLFFVLRIHHQQIVSNHALRNDIEHLKTSVREQLEEHRNTLGFNISGMKYIQRVVAEKHIKIGGDDDRDGKRARLF